ncbi:glycoside hydrolase family 3 N-terminal domain-containing protein [Planotetraspora sp. GP83]|uniref:glycoside hydrolase family 3 N-terminal domain-containing protein n=1 Tax=Planotetraspora sp. GP83 TaxID=3156264 RepID=UPI003512ED9E
MNELDRLVNACLLPGFGGTEAPPWVHEALEHGLAGVTIFPANHAGRPGSIAEIARALRETRPDALVSIDEEGGDVTRLDYETGSAYPGNLALGVVDDLDLTRRVAAAIAADLAASGVNYNLAPSVDVNSDPDNPIIGVRSFGSDPERVGAHGAAYVRAMRDAGIAVAVKHFPGHGATVSDSHHSLPVIDCDLDTFRRRELAPFVAAIEAGAASLMTAHVVFEALDPGTPATVSRRILHDLVRVELGYEGVLVSTAVAMEAAAGPSGIVATAVRAFQAGADLQLLGPLDGEPFCAAIRAGVADAVRAGELDVSVLETAAARVAAMRAGAVPRPGPAPDRSVGLEAARRAVRVTGDVVLSGPATVVELRAPANVAVGEAHWSVTERLADLGLVAHSHRVDEHGASAEEIVEGAKEGPLVIVVRDAYRIPWQRAWVGKVLAARPDTVLVAVGMPDDAAAATGPSVVTYGAGRVNTQVAAELLAGRRAGSLDGSLDGSLQGPAAGEGVAADE